MAKDKKYIVGYNMLEGKMYVYKDANEASRECQIWKTIEAETAADAKEKMQEIVDNELENTNE